MALQYSDILSPTIRPPRATEYQPDDPFAGTGSASQAPTGRGVDPGQTQTITDLFYRGSHPSLAGGPGDPHSPVLSIPTTQGTYTAGGGQQAPAGAPAPRTNPVPFEVPRLDGGGGAGGGSPLPVGPAGPLPPPLDPGSFATPVGGGGGGGIGTPSPPGLPRLQPGAGAAPPGGDLQSLLNTYATSVLGAPSRYDIPLVQQGIGLIKSEFGEGLEEGRNYLDELMSSRGLVGSSVETEQHRELFEDLTRTKNQQLFNLAREMATTQGADRTSAAGIAQGALGMDLERWRTQRVLELQQQGMDQDEAFRRADLEVRERLAEQDQWLRELAIYLGVYDMLGLTPQAGGIAAPQAP